MFFDFINTTDPDVDAYLWEYGTSSFASKLVRTMYGVDEFTLDTFRNSHCILDNARFLSCGKHCCYYMLNLYADRKVIKERKRKRDESVRSITDNQLMQKLANINKSTSIK